MGLPGQSNIVSWPELKYSFDILNVKTILAIDRWAVGSCVEFTVRSGCHH